MKKSQWWLKLSQERSTDFSQESHSNYNFDYKVTKDEEETLTAN